MKTHVASRLAIIGLLCGVLLPAKAERIELVSGNLAFLSDTHVVRVKYDYDGMMVGKVSEADYIARKAKEFNDKEPGKGEKWLTNWKNDRGGRFAPAFEREISKSLTGAIVFGSAHDDARYTLILKTLVTEPGWAGTPWALINFHSDSYIDATATFVETSNPEHVLAVIQVRDAPGNGNDYDPAGRIEAAYATCGKLLGNYLRHTHAAPPGPPVGATADYSREFSSDKPNDIVRRLKELRSPEYASAVPAILPLLLHENENVVRDACRTLAVIGNKSVIPSIEPLLADRRRAVRKDAQAAIDTLRAKP